MIQFSRKFTKTFLGPSYLLQSIYQSHTSTMCTVSYPKPSEMPRFFNFRPLQIIYLSQIQSDLDVQGFKMIRRPWRIKQAMFGCPTPGGSVSKATEPVFFPFNFHVHMGGSAEGRTSPGYALCPWLRISKHYITRFPTSHTSHFP